ncbi:hypothetical protein KY363_06305 [Candidatus Woesearchaeota archaeon]|nr:hypothetical protein [Candidatus Woesearchaeota archaeon]
MGYLKGTGEAERAARLISQAQDSVARLSELGMTSTQAAKLVSTHQGIPFSVFNTQLGTLESAVKYLREELSLSYESIGALLGRGPGPIGVTYRRTRSKHPARLTVTPGESLPFNAFRDRRLSVLESAANYLAAQGHDWHEIAQIMRRNDKTIWTVLDRARRKLAK